jgi:capsular polysaccharide transport system permease protein
LVQPAFRASARTAIAAGLPVPAEDGGAIAVFQPQEFTARRRRVPVRLLSLVVVVLVPATLAALYYFLIAADQYVAEFRFALRTVEPARAEVGGLFQGNVAPSPVGVDSYAVVQYLGSRDVIDELGKTLDLREMFSRAEADWVSRLPPGIDRRAGQVLEKSGGRVLRHH